MSNSKFIKPGETAITITDKNGNVFSAPSVLRESVVMYTKVKLVKGKDSVMPDGTKVEASTMPAGPAIVMDLVHDGQRSSAHWIYKNAVARDADYKNLEKQLDSE